MNPMFNRPHPLRAGHRRWPVMLLCAMVFLLAACGGDDEPPTPTPAVAPPTNTPAPAAPADTPVPTGTPAPTDTPVVESPLATPEDRAADSPLATPDGRSVDSPLATPDGRSLDSPLATPEPAGETMTDEQILARLIERAQEQLQEEIGAAPEDITVAESEAVTWPDAGLGCPDPDEVYAAVLTPGYRLLLEAEGESYAFHTDGDPEGRIVLCRQPSTP